MMASDNYIRQISSSSPFIPISHLPLSHAHSSAKVKASLLKSGKLTYSNSKYLLSLIRDAPEEVGNDNAEAILEEHVSRVWQEGVSNKVHPTSQLNEKNNIIKECERKKRTNLIPQTYNNREYERNSCYPAMNNKLTNGSITSTTNLLSLPYQHSVSLYNKSTQMKRSFIEVLKMRIMPVFQDKSHKETVEEMKEMIEESFGNEVDDDDDEEDCRYIRRVKLKKNNLSTTDDDNEDEDEDEVDVSKESNLHQNKLEQVKCSWCDDSEDETTFSSSELNFLNANTENKNNHSIYISSNKAKSVLFQNNNKDEGKNHTYTDVSQQGFNTLNLHNSVEAFKRNYNYNVWHNDLFKLRRPMRFDPPVCQFNNNSDNESPYNDKNTSSVLPNEEKSSEISSDTVENSKYYMGSKLKISEKEKLYKKNQPHFLQNECIVPYKSSSLEIFPRCMKGTSNFNERKDSTNFEKHFKDRSLNVSSKEFKPKITLKPQNHHTICSDNFYKHDEETTNFTPSQNNGNKHDVENFLPEHSPNIFTNSVVVGYYYGDDPIPYRIVLPFNNPTLGQFKKYLNKKGDFKYFFKKVSDEFDSGVVHDEITDDADFLPLWQGKVIGKVEFCS